MDYRKELERKFMNPKNRDIETLVSLLTLTNEEIK